MCQWREDLQVHNGSVPKSMAVNSADLVVIQFPAKAQGISVYIDVKKGYNFVYQVFIICIIACWLWCLNLFLCTFKKTYR